MSIELTRASLIPGSHAEHAAKAGLLALNQIDSDFRAMEKAREAARVYIEESAIDGAVEHLAQEVQDLVILDILRMEATSAQHQAAVENAIEELLAEVENRP